MAYNVTWDGAFEGLPPDTGENIASGATRIRSLKEAVRERLNTDHYFDPAGTDADHGLHRRICFRAQIADPANVANQGFLYTKDVSAKVELFWEDEDGNKVQLTNAGAINVIPIPSGSKMLFYADAAPTGWTLINTMDDKLVFVTKGSGAGGQIGGAVHSTGTWTLAGLTDSGHTHAAGSYAGPNHTHTLASAGALNTCVYANKIGIMAGELVDGAGGAEAGTRTSSTTGNPSATALTGSSASGTATIVSAGTWRPAAYSFIVCSKN